MLPNNTFKIIVCGPQRVGKTVLSNTISEFSNIVPTEYKPTVGLRILECEREFTEEQLKSIPLLKGKNTNKVKIQLWDMSGDKRLVNTNY
jgi:Rab-like protein 5